jgi:hypothetical protein
LFCYTAIFLALIHQFDAPRTYIQEGFFNSQEECESALVLSARRNKLDLEFRETSEGLVGFFSDSDGSTYYQCTSVNMPPEPLCEQGLLDKFFGTFSSCDCSKLNNQSD